jgi:hypothetical protein
MDTLSTLARSISWHTDQWNSWLQVPKAFAELHDFYYDISSESYQDDTSVYLGEDCDADLFFKELLDAKYFGSFSEFSEFSGSIPTVNYKFDFLIEKKVRQF